MRDQQTELSILDPAEGVHLARLRIHHRNQFAQNPPQPSFPILSAEHLIGVDLEDGDGQVVPESRGPTYLPVKQVLQVATAVSAGLTIAGRGLFGLDQLASHHDRVKALGAELIDRSY